MVKQEEIMQDEILEKFSRLVDFNTSFFRPLLFRSVDDVYKRKNYENWAQWTGMKKKRGEKKKETNNA